MFSFKSIYFVIFTLILCKIHAEISDKRLCVDQNCSELISFGKTLLRYSSPEKYVLSFIPNEDVKIYSYGAGTRPELVGVEIKGKRGYINKSHVKETRLIKRPALVVDTEIDKNKPEVVLEGGPTEIKADPTLQPFEIVDGTKIPLELSSFSTEAPEVNVENKQSSEDSTKPLESVPEIGKPAVPHEPKDINKDENNVEKQQQMEFDNNEDEDSDDEDDDLDDENTEDEDNEDDESVNVNEATQTQDGAKSALENDALNEKLSNVGNEAVQDSSDSLNTAAENAVKSDEDKLEEANKKNINEGIDVSPSQIIAQNVTDAADQIDIVEHKVTDNSEQLKTVVTETLQNEPEFTKSATEGPVPLAAVSAIENDAEAKDIFNEAQEAAGGGGIFSNIVKGLENYVTKNAKENQKIVGEIEDLLGKAKASEPTEETASLPVSSTAIPMDLEAAPPVNVDLVTPNPLQDDSQNIFNTQEDYKNDTEDPLNPKETLLDIKDYQEGAQPNIEENRGDGGLVGLGNKLPLFVTDKDTKVEKDSNLPNVEDNQLPEENMQSKDGLAGLPLFSGGKGLEIGEKSNLPNVQDNQLLQENMQSKDFVVPQNTIAEEGSIATKQDDLFQSSENTISSQGLAEDGPVATDRNDLFQSSENTINSQGLAEDGPVAIDQNDLFQNSENTIHSQETSQKSEPELSEDVTVADEQVDLTHIPETSEQSKVDDTESEGEPSEGEPSEGFFSNIMSFFRSEESVKSNEKNEEVVREDYASAAGNILDSSQTSNADIDSSGILDSLGGNVQVNKDYCDKEVQDCSKYRVGNIEHPQEKISRTDSLGAEELQILFIEAVSSDLFLYLTTTALSVIFLVFGMVILDKCRRERPLIARINKLEQQLLTTIKENEMLQEKATMFVEEKTQLVVETVPNEVVEELNQKLAEMNQIKLALEEQIQALEKELDTSTEVGIELNKIITEMLNSSDGSEIIKENIEQMQKKLLEQQDTINTVNDTLSLKETENHELRLEMDISNRKVIDLQSELDKMVEKILKIEEERDQQHSILENEIKVYQTKYQEAASRENVLRNEIQALKQQITKLQRLAEVKVKEYNNLKESLNEVKLMKNNKDALKSLLEVSEIKAQLEQFKAENLSYSEQLAQEREVNVSYGSKMENLMQEVEELREKYEKSDKEKVEINTKLQVLNNYFKEKEDQMQKEISKYESLWAAKEGEATSTTERIRYMQEELQNYKAQNESLKQEIVNQEVDLKSQISMLEKKAHENWVTNRQTERKLEEAKQEAAQLRNRLTLRERAIAEGNNQIRIQSPLHQNGDLPISPPPPIDPTQSPPPLFNPRDHLAKSPPIPGMPPPFFPPPLGGAPFIPPPPLNGMLPPIGDIGGMPPPPHFMPPLPGMFPGDHRPPPLGRMSSPPPVGGRYSPESTVYSDYDRYSRRSPSPPYDSEYGASPPPIRGYSPYQDRLRDDRREYQRPQARTNGRNSKGIHSSGSENDSLGKNKKPQRKA